jgi:hypothetical protein
MTRSWIGLFAIALWGCGDNDARTSPHAFPIQRIPCTSARDCAPRGDVCSGGECHAGNECSGVGDCPADNVCAPDPNFGGLCTPIGPSPQAGAPCGTGRDCPLGQGCGSDARCHTDGECQAADGTNPDVGCADGMICYNAGNDVRAGFCGAPRPSANPYCRSDGLGACRSRCFQDGSCSDGGTCLAGYCHRVDECSSAADCSPNHVCALPTGWEDDGYRLCLESDDPQCTTAPDGVCRLPCRTSADCVHGGGCGVDGFCHASNECRPAAPSCPDGQICYSTPEFGGLCGPSR